MGLGSNVGDRHANLAAAVRAIGELATIEALSSVYAADPVGYTDQPQFWNLVMRIRTNLTPETLLDGLKRIEQRLGRVPTFRFGPRRIDIDILLWNGRVVSSQPVEIPHPRMLERAFVLLPLVELDPELRHPVTGEKLSDRLAAGAFERITRLFPGERLMADTK